MNLNLRGMRKTMGKPFKPAQKSRHVVQSPKSAVFRSVDEFWAASVKNGSPELLKVFKAHLSALGTLEKPDKWAQGALHFGIPMEK
jgi:hypothetical protein